MFSYILPFAFNFAACGFKMYVLRFKTYVWHFKSTFCHAPCHVWAIGMACFAYALERFYKVIRTFKSKV